MTGTIVFGEPQIWGKIEAHCVGDFLRVVCTSCARGKLYYVARLNLFIFEAFCPSYDTERLCKRETCLLIS